MAEIIIDYSSTSSSAAPASWGTVPGCSHADVPVAGTSSVLLLVFTATLDDTADACAEFRFLIDSVAQTPILTGFTDATSQVNGTTLMWAVDGYTGDTDFEVQWQIVSGSPALDASKKYGFQVMEFASGAEILVDASAIDEESENDYTWTALANPHGNGTAVTTGAKQLFIFQWPHRRTCSDDGCDLQFYTGSAQDGPITSNWGDYDNEVQGNSLSWFEEGLTGTLDFKVYFRRRNNTPGTPTTHYRTFQVLEFGDTCTIESNYLGVSDETSGATWADVSANEQADVAVDGTDSVVLMLACGVIETDNGDTACDFSLAYNDTNEGPVYSSFNDETDGISGYNVFWGKTGITGTQDFSYRWINVTANPGTDVARNRAFQVVQFTEAAGGQTVTDMGCAEANGSSYALSQIHYLGLPVAQGQAQVGQTLEHLGLALANAQAQVPRQDPQYVPAATANADAFALSQIEYLLTATAEAQAQAAYQPDHYPGYAEAQGVALDAWWIGCAEAYAQAYMPICVCIAACAEAWGYAEPVLVSLVAQPATATANAEAISPSGIERAGLAVASAEIPSVNTVEFAGCAEAQAGIPGLIQVQAVPTATANAEGQAAYQTKQPVGAATANAEASQAQPLNYLGYAEAEGQAQAANTIEHMGYAEAKAEVPKAGLINFAGLAVAWAEAPASGLPGLALPGCATANAEAFAADAGGFQDEGQMDLALRLGL